MPRKRFTAENIILKLRGAEVLLAQGQKTPEVCRGATPCGHPASGGFMRGSARETPFSPHVTHAANSGPL